MQTLSEVTVIIVAYNSRDVLPQQWPVLEQLSHVIVVDNASQDGTAAWVAEQLPQARLLVMPENVGFGRAHNHAMAQCQTPFALLLNPDCVIELDAIATLAECLQRHASALMAVPALIYPDGSAQENHRGFFHTRDRARPAYRLPTGETCCEMVSGAVMLVRTETFRSIGGFDPWFFLYWEDEELCIRARQLQLAVLLAPQAVACHVAQTSSAPSLRGTFIRHYCYTSSKLYLRRKLGESAPLLMARALATLLSSLLALPVNVIGMSQKKAMRSIARIAAVLTAPWQLGRERCVATPLQLLNKVSANADG